MYRREGRHQWKQQEVASIKIKLMSIRKPSRYGVERCDRWTASIYKQTTGLFFLVYLLLQMQCLAFRYPPHVDVSLYRHIKRWRRFLVLLARALAGSSDADQKKGGKRPEPAQPDKPKPEPTNPDPGKPKPEREGDKGKRKGKIPRTEQFIALTLWKRKISLI